jgi:hypothetical protein
MHGKLLRMVREVKGKGGGRKGKGREGQKGANRRGERLTPPGSPPMM